MALELNCYASLNLVGVEKKTEMSGKGEVLKAALEEDPPLAAEQMARRLGFGCPGVLRRRFPRQYQALRKKRRAYEEAQRNQLRSDLIKALAENPAPTVLAVCAAWRVFEPSLLSAPGFGPRDCGQTLKRAG
jgi:hypothetical protein